jgi:hypothetical protein
MINHMQTILYSNAEKKESEDSLRLGANSPII